MTNKLNLDQIKKIISEIETNPDNSLKIFNKYNASFSDMLRISYFFEKVKSNKTISRDVSNYISYSSVPLLYKIDIFEHQRKCLGLIVQREKDFCYGIRGAIISMDPGMGKTLVSLVMILGGKKYVDIVTMKSYPSLVICSKTLLNEWINEINKSFIKDSVKYIIFHKSNKESATITRESLMEYDLILTTPETVVGTFNGINVSVEEAINGTTDQSKKQFDRVTRQQLVVDPNSKGLNLIFTTPWNRVIYDESTQLSNYKSLIFNAANKIFSHTKWCLSGTPIVNYLTDIWSQLYFIGYNGVTSPTNWLKNGMTYYNNHNLGNAVLRLEYGKEKVVMPEKEIVKIVLVLHGMERTFYEVVDEITKKTFRSFEQKTTSYASAFAALLKMRVTLDASILCLDSKVIESISGGGNRLLEGNNFADVDQELVNIETMKQTDKVILGQINQRQDASKIKNWLADINGTAGIGSTKFREILKLINEVIPESESIVIFSSFTKVLDLFSEAIKKNAEENKISYNTTIQVDGRMSTMERDKALDNFRFTNDHRILLLSLKIGEKGLNLTRANNLIFIEAHWTSPTQAINRVWRIGQTRDVKVFYFVFKDSVEERVIKIIEKKENMISNLLGDDDKGKIQNANQQEILTEKLTLEEFKSVLGF